MEISGLQVDLFSKIDMVVQRMDQLIISIQISTLKI